jgi:hypothetical protein
MLTVCLRIYDNARLLTKVTNINFRGNASSLRFPLNARVRIAAAVTNSDIANNSGSIRHSVIKLEIQNWFISKFSTFWLRTRSIGTNAEHPQKKYCHKTDTSSFAQLPLGLSNEYQTSCSGTIATFLQKIQPIQVRITWFSFPKLVGNQHGHKKWSTLAFCISTDK